MLQKGDPQRILNSSATKEKQIILLWMITEIDYRGPIGEEAVQALRKVIISEDVLRAFHQIVGFAKATPSTEILIETFSKLAAGILY